MDSKKKKTSKKVTKKSAPKKPIAKPQAVSQSIKRNAKQPKAVLTTTSKKVDTSTPVNKWIGSDFEKYLDELELEPLHNSIQQSQHEHKMLELADVPEESFRPSWWVRVLWWFVK